MMHLVSLLFFILFLSFSNLVSSDVYIVMVDTESKPSVFLKQEHWYKATLQTLHSNTTDDQQKILPITHVYKTVFIGFSADLTQQQAAEVANKPGVTAVMLDSVLQLHTTHSPSFLGLYTHDDNNNNAPGRLLSMSDFGSNVIIGVIDSGICPEHPSFGDEGLGLIPSKWKGECEEGQKFKKSLCNKKIIGARFFTKGYEKAYGKINRNRSARDSDGHGTHMASTAAGRAVGNASLFGYARGTAVGVAPKARIAAYKVCWENGCMVSDVLSAFEKAVEDGVDVISLSIGGRVMSNVDLIAIGSFEAMKRGVFVSASAGNSGHRESSVQNVAPWMTTVGAGTIDRSFAADLVLGDGRVLNGSSIYNGKPLPKNKMIPIYYPADSCDSSLDQEEVRGKIVVCIRRRTQDFHSQEAAVKSAGGVAIVVSDRGMHGPTLRANVHSIPGLTLTIPSLRTISDYIDHSSPNATATIVFRGTEFGIKPAPIVASFSSRGPTYVCPFQIKPDIIAPGVNILAAWPYGEFNILSGASTSCSHISGMAALLKGAHTDWTPAMIRSAMMTTAYTKDKQGQQILDSYDYTNATVWAMGAGQVDPEKAVDPGLVYDVSPDDYLNFLCASKYSIEDIRYVANSTRKRCCSDQSDPWNLNYPAITVDFNAYDKMMIVVTRTVTHVSNNSATYTVNVVNPKGVDVRVTPVKIKFHRKGEKKIYNVRITAQRSLTVAPGEPATPDVGEIVWSDGERNVVSPVVINWKKDY